MALPVAAPCYRAFRLPRQGYSLEECQDALACDAERGRFTIADGAAESPYSSLWAQLLVEEFVRRSDRLPNWANWLPSLQERWKLQVGAHVGARSPDRAPSLTEGLPFADEGDLRSNPRAGSGDPAPTGSNPRAGSGDPAPTGGDPAPTGGAVPWYLEEGLRQGAFATFLGLVIEDKSWFALAVGDSCLFHVRQGQLICAFPLTRAADFGNAPWLVGSRTSPIEVPHKNGLQQMGDCRSGDRLWLMTDALAQWFLIQRESGGKPWLALEPFVQAIAEEAVVQQAFAAWIEGLRAARQLRNDDVTLLAVCI